MDDEVDYSYQITFKADGTVVDKEVSPNGDVFSYAGRWSVNEDGLLEILWEIESFLEEPSLEIYTFVIKGNKLYLDSGTDDEEVYVRV